MEQGAVEQVVEALRPLAAKIGEGAEALYAVTVRQVFIDGVQRLVWAGLALLLSVAAFVVARLTWRRGTVESRRDVDRFGGDQEFYDFLTVTLVGAGTVLLVVALLVVDGAIDALLNPHYDAVQRILSAVRGD